MLKKTIIVLVVLVVLIVAAMLVLYSSFDSIVLKAIENYGSEVTGTRVEVESVSISLTEGRGTIKGVKVANPEGFSDPYAFKLTEVTLDIDPASVRSSPFLIEQVFIHEPEIVFERRADGTSNLGIIRKKIEEYRESRGAPSVREGEVEGEPARFIIEEFRFEKGHVVVKAPEVLKENMEVPLAQVRLNDIGGRDGATAGETGRIILDAFIRAVSNAVARQGIDRVIEDRLDEKTGEAVKGVLDSIF